MIETWMTLLASTGSVAPFIGLFGTVWGIMHSFIGIAQAQNTSKNGMSGYTNPSTATVNLSYDRLH